jgi:LysM repeat protein
VTVRSGDTLGRYASRHGVSVESILRANPGLNPRNMQLGQSIVIPGGAVQPAPRVASASGQDYELRDGASGSRRYTTHVVRSGETAWAIAVKKYGIGPGDLAAANPEINLDRLQPGTVLRVPRR